MKSKLNLKNYIEFFNLFLLFFIVFCIFFSSTLFNSFDYHDSFYTYVNEKFESCSLHPQYLFFLEIGRPLYAYIFCKTVLPIIYYIQDAAIVRLLAIFSIAIFATCLYKILKKIRIFPQTILFIFVACLFILPSGLLFIYESQATPIVVAYGASILSFYFLNNFFQRNLSKNDINLKWYCFNFKDAINLFLSVFFLIIGSSIYQQLTPIIFSLTFLIIANMEFKNRAKMRLIFITSITIYVIHGILYIILYKNVLLDMLQLSNNELQLISNNERAIRLTVNFSEKINILIEVTKRASMLWFFGSYHASKYVIYLSIIALSIGIYLDYVKSKIFTNNHITAFMFSIEKLIITLTLILLTNSLNLVAYGSSLFFRHMIPYQWIIVFLILSKFYELADFYSKDINVSLPKYICTSIFSIFIVFVSSCLCPVLFRMFPIFQFLS